jgi:glycosyltransferase involved in cell wall biosynthesis
VTPSSASRYRRIGVVVPAHNEQDTLPRCLRALETAAASAPAATTVVVVLDSCTDNSADLLVELAGQLDLDLRCLPVQAKAVGAARSAGADWLTRQLGAAGTWLANTDADSAVPAHWLQRQLCYAEAGARVVAGTVAVEDWLDFHPRVRTHAERLYLAHLRIDPERGHQHVHGANLGLDAALYESVGGFGADASDEDVRLIAAIAEAGAPITWAADLAVTTSARRQGRAPAGFSAYLQRLETVTFAAAEVARVNTS